MAAPIITLAAKTFDAATINLSTATCAGGAFSELQGETGADWWYWQSNSYTARSKKEGGSQLFPVVFNDSGSAPFLNSNVYRPVLWTAADEVAAQGGSAVDGCVVVNIPASQANSGIRFTILADQKLRRFTWFGKTYNGTYTVKATLADGSYTLQTLVVPNEPSHAWFTCDFRAASTTTIAIEIRRTAATGDEGYVFAQAAHLGIPVKPARPRGLSSYLTYLGIAGGTNT